MKLFLSLAKSSLLILLLCCCNNTLFAQTPIAYYPFTGNANDAIGTNHGTVNGATLTTDRFGNANSAYQFDGVNDIINFANLATTQVDNFTVSAWVNSANLNQWGFIVANCYDDGSSANGWTLLQRSTAQVGGATGAYVSGHYSAASWLDIGQSMNSTNTWYHLTLVRDNGVTKFYLNGTSNGQTNNATPNTPTGSLAIGGSYPSANFFNGAIDEVKIYNTALTPTQVQQEYTSSAPTLIAHYPFTGNANDAIGTNHGTVNGATLTTDRFGNANSAYQFDGVNDIINFANLATTQVDNFTMTAWVKTASLSQYAQIAINGTDQPGVTADGWGIRQRNISYSAGSPGSYITADYPNVAVLNIGQTISTANQWIQIALVRNNGVSSFYINGVSTNITDNNTPATPTGSLKIGGNPGVGFFNGAIDEVKIYNTALTPTQIQQEYTSSAPTLIAHYPFTGNANDAIGSNHGTSNGAVLTTDRFGNANSAYNFDGINDIINFSNLASTQVDNFTASAWVKSASLTESGIIVANGFDNFYNAGNGWLITQRATSGWSPGNYLTAHYPYVAFLNIGQSITAANVWHHVALVRDSGVATFYIDGVSSGVTTNASPITPTGSLCIGGSNPGVGYFDGAIDEVKIYNTPMTPAQVLADYNATAPIASTAKSLHFDGNDDHITLGNWGTMPNQGTIAFYMNAASSANIPNAFCTHGSGNAGFRLEWYAPGGFGLLSGDDGGGFTPYTMIPAGNVQTNQWYHIAFTWDKTTNTIQGYVDGVQVFNSTCTQWATNWPNVQIGHGYGSNRVWNGYLDEFVFYNNVLTPTEINNLKVCSPTFPASNLLAYYNFNQGMDLANNSTVTTLVDATGNQNGTLNNFALTGATSNWSSATSGAITCTGIILTAGSIGASQTICGTNTPAMFTNTTSASITNNATITYQWQESTVSGTWTNIAGANAATYQAANTAGIKYFRRKASALAFEAYSNVVTLDITNIVGNPATFGPNQWNVYCYNGYDVDLGSGVDYRGMYSVNTLDVNSTNEFNTSSSPSSYSGYQGCNVNADFFTWVYKRQGFPDGDYVMSSTGCDDVAKIYVNGNLVYNYVGFSAFNNISLGHLDANSTIEIRCADWSSSAYANFIFTTASFNGGTISGTQSQCGSYTPSLLGNAQSAYGGSSLSVSYQWQQSADGTNWFDLSSLNPVHQPGLISSTTYFRRRATNGNNEQAYSNVVIASVTSSTWYADADGDGFGNVNITQISCSQPNGYVTSSTDCNDADALEYPGQLWFQDADNDGYSNNATQVQCTRPINYKAASELLSTSYDCNDNHNHIHPGAQYLTFTGAPNFTNQIVYPLQGDPYTQYHYEVNYFNIYNEMPENGAPRLSVDLGQNFILDPNDKRVSMIADDANDLNTVDGKKYFLNVTGIQPGTIIQSYVSPHLLNCDYLGPFQNTPIVMTNPNLSILAQDITFSNFTPSTSENISVSAIIRNTSDYDVTNVTMKLINQFDETIVYPNQVATLIPQHGSATVTWNISTPSIAGLCPMKVIVDVNETIAETNEDDNIAIRGFANGGGSVQGGIFANATISPATVYVFPSQITQVAVSGNAFYTGVSNPLLNTPVPGAEVKISITETGQQFTGFTNGNGYFNIPVNTPVGYGTYHLTGQVYDYTWSGNITFTSNMFNVLQATAATPTPELIPSNGFGNPYYTVQILSGQSISGTYGVTNAGTANATSTFKTKLAVNGPNGYYFEDILSQSQLMQGASATSQTINLGVMNTPGLYFVTVTADDESNINEIDEGNNSTTHVFAVLSQYADLYVSNIGSTISNRCGSDLPVTAVIRNGGTIPSVSTHAKIRLKENGNVIAEATLAVPALAASENYTIQTIFNPSFQPSLFTYEVIADLNMEQSEANENNNSNQTQSFIDTCKADLLVASDCEAITIVSANNTYSGQVTLKAKIYNAGLRTSVSPFLVRFDFLNGTFYDQIFSGTLQPGESTEVSLVINNIPSGATHLKVIVDPLNSINEYDENNNASLNKPLGWEYIHTGGSCFLFMNNYLAYTGGFINFYAPILSTGLYTTNSLEVQFALSGPGITGVQTIGTGEIYNVKTSCYCPQIVSIPTLHLISQPGIYHVFITIDPNNLITESDEANNVIELLIETSDKPDMRILQTYITPSNLNPIAGQTITTQVSYENIGKANITDQMKMRLLIDNQAIDSVINLPGLLQNEKATVNFTIPWSSTLPGVHIVKAVIDADQVINELSESNNENVRPIIVGDAANMHFNSLTASIINPILNQNIAIQSSIENNGTLTCTSTISFYYINNLNDKIFIKSMPITLAGNTSQNVNFIWKVLDEETTIIGEITNSTTQEFDYGDNNTSFQLGKMNIVLEATPACTTGTLFAGILGGTQPYNYQWSNGSANATMTDIEGNYNITVTDATGQTASASGVIPTCKLTLSLKAYLQGYYQGNGTMQEALFNQGRVNLHTHCDSIDVELHNTNDYSLVASHRALLKTDGTLNAFFETALMNNSYYIVLKHRNSLETWSASPILLSSNTMYDFTMAVNKAFGSNMLEIEPSIFAFYTGDINQDGFIDSFDFPLLDNDIFNGVSGVYINTDLNGDGFVDSFDFPLFDINSFNGISVIRP